ncbi:protein spindle-F [Teleopsis dalmanni]|uniref:protein spindle-F-like n=1 Tax=Teleopsis dalmanni TaxID=139649 RepID=UPI0018CE8AEC|nr:protein spindle-F-like [Teleopsis dalmanni]XP_037945677.1 protein spindle-F [Teleopsis dalmanni]
MDTPDTMQIALRVALQTMKERCVALQERLTIVEEENRELREENAQPNINHNYDTSDGTAENLQLRMQIAELQRQKTQLSEHINMVSTENRKLWSRLSQMAKDQGKVVGAKENDNTVVNDDEHDAVNSPRRNSGANQNLIRSKTFTQHSPNPQLRQKLISNEISDDINDLSMEEVALNAYSGNNRLPNKTDLGFTYFNVDETTIGADATTLDVNQEAKKCIAGLDEMRAEALKQQQGLYAALTAIESRIALQPCSKCAQKAKKPEMADKSLETDESLTDVKFFNNNQTVLEVNTNSQSHNNIDTNDKPSQPTQHLNIIEEKIKADEADKMCPMCGKIYSSVVTFDSFREHVETHFIDDSLENDTSFDRFHNELISHTVGDF